MIVFDLICEDEHQFEGWFRNSDEFKKQQTNGMLTCPVCGTDNITKVPSASHVNLRKMEKQVSELLSIRSDAQQLVNNISAYINRHFDDVGEAFPDEARRMHYGESDERNIRGTATLEQARELYEEGIDVIPIMPDDKKDKLN